LQDRLVPIVAHITYVIFNTGLIPVKAQRALRRRRILRRAAASNPAAGRQTLKNEWPA